MGLLLWLSWEIGCFWHQRATSWIQSLANFYLQHLLTVNFIEKTKIKKKSPEIANFLKKQTNEKMRLHLLNFFHFECFNWKPLNHSVLGPILQNWFCQNSTAVKLRLHFDVWFEFVPTTLDYQFQVLLMLPKGIAAENTYWFELTLPLK